MLSKDWDTSLLYLKEVYQYPNEKLENRVCLCSNYFPIDQLEDHLLKFDDNEKMEEAHKWIGKFFEKMSIVHETLTNHKKECISFKFSDNHISKLINVLSKKQLV